MEAVDAARNRTEVKHRKARNLRMSLPLETKSKFCQRDTCIGDGFERSAVSLTRGGLSAPIVSTMVTIKDERTRW